MRHARITEDCLRIHALAVKARKEGRRGRAVKATIMEAETDFLSVRQKILATGKNEKKNSPQQSHLRWTCSFRLSRGKAATEGLRRRQTCNFSREWRC